LDKGKKTRTSYVGVVLTHDYVNTFKTRGINNVFTKHVSIKFLLGPWGVLLSRSYVRFPLVSILVGKFI